MLNAVNNSLLIPILIVTTFQRRIEWDLRPQGRQIYVQVELSNGFVTRSEGPSANDG